MIDYLKNVPKYDPYLKELGVYTKERKAVHDIKKLDLPLELYEGIFDEKCKNLEPCEIWRKFTLPNKRIKNRFIKYIGFKFDSDLFETRSAKILSKLYEMIFLSLFLSFFLSFFLSKIFTSSIYRVLTTIRVLDKNIESDIKVPKTKTKELNELSFAFNNLVEKLKKKRKQTKKMATDILKIADNERRNISRDLHDSVGQLIVAASIKVSYKKNEEAKELLLLANEELRNIYDELEPRFLEKMSLHDAVEWYLLKFFSKEFAYHIDVKVAEAFKPEVRVQVYRIIQEAIANAKKHSQKNEYLEIKITKNSEGMIIVIKNDINDPVMKEGTSLGRGLKNIQLRAESLGGYFEIKRSDKTFTLIVRLVPEKEGED